MGVLSESYIQNLEHNAIAEALLKRKLKTSGDNWTRVEHEWTGIEYKWMSEYKWTRVKHKWILISTNEYE